MGYKQATEGLSDAEGYALRSVTEIKVLDAISEGPIEGLVSAYLDYSNKGTEGNVGYDNLPDVKEYKPTSVGIYKSVFFNEVPVVGENGRLNFQNASITQYRGYSSAIERPDGTNTLTIVRVIGEKFRAENGPKTYRLYNKYITGFDVNFRILQMSFTRPSGDDTEARGYTASYTIEVRAVYGDSKDLDQSWTILKSETISAFISEPYMHKVRVEVPHITTDKNLLGWDIRLTKTSPDIKFLDSRGPVQVNIYIDSITELYQEYFSYPHTAVIVSRFNSEFFSSVPQRAFDVWLKKVKIPSNYDPTKRTYDESSPWNGTFNTNLFYTNNPAWVFYDLITNERYGLGKYITADQIDKWSLYTIAKYCDTLVQDGYGGLEPRFTCNVYLQSREDAYKVLNDLASVFNAITYYGGGQIYAVQDSPKDPIVAFTNANVENGDFNYSNTSRKFRHTTALVRWNDPANFYRPAVEIVEDLENIRKFGVKQVDLTAFACTSRGQAIRTGRYVLLSENLETETINFVTGLEGAYLRPGDIFKVFDRNRKTTRLAGRTSRIWSDATFDMIELDDDLGSNLDTSDVSNSYKLTLINTSYNLDPDVHSQYMNQGDADEIRRSFVQEYTFSGISSQSLVEGVTRIYFPLGTIDDTNFDVEVPCIWVIELSTNPTTYANSSKFLDENYDQYRTIKVDEKDGGKYEVFGIQYAPTKFAQVESGLQFARATNIYRAIPTAPTAVSISVEPPSS